LFCFVFLSIIYFCAQRQGTALLIFKVLAFLALGKNKCAVCAVAFFRQVINVVTIFFSLWVTDLYMTSSALLRVNFHSSHKPNLLHFAFNFFSQSSNQKIWRHTKYTKIFGLERV